MVRRKKLFNNRRIKTFQNAKKNKTSKTLTEHETNALYVYTTNDGSKKSTLGCLGKKTDPKTRRYVNRISSGIIKISRNSRKPSQTEIYRVLNFRKDDIALITECYKEKLLYPFNKHTSFTKMKPRNFKRNNPYFKDKKDVFILSRKNHVLGADISHLSKHNEKEILIPKTTNVQITNITKKNGRIIVHGRLHHSVDK